MPRDEDRVTYSVVICSRNRRPQLEHAFPTVLAQNPPEIIFVDDGSTDGTEEFVKDRVTHYIQTGSAGYGRGKQLADAWGQGCAKASHEVIVHSGGEIGYLPGALDLITENIGPREIGLATVYHIPLVNAEDILSRDPEPLYLDDWQIGQDDGYPQDTRWGAAAPMQANGMTVYCGKPRATPLIFSGAMRKALWDELGGYSANIPKALDDDFANRAINAGVTFKGFGQAIAIHIAHDRS